MSSFSTLIADGFAESHFCPHAVIPVICGIRGIQKPWMPDQVGHDEGYRHLWMPDRAGHDGEKKLLNTVKGDATLC
jgi:hypothetical protein